MQREITSKWVYTEFLRKVNNNATQNNLSVDFYRFISLFNESQVTYLRWLMDRRIDDELTPATSFLVPNTPLKLKKKFETHWDYKLPEDVFEKVNVSLYANKGKCTDQRIKVRERKQESHHILELDDNNRPDFDYRQAFYSFNENGLSIYRGDMVPNRVLLTYYRYPCIADIAGYVHPDKSNSKDIDPDKGWDIDAIYTILKIMVFKYDTNNNIDRTQLDNLLVQSKIY